jgi:hypothetical protein
MPLVVGLIMGTRMWYAMWDAEKDDEATFERRVDGVVREIGERGKVVVPEAVPPLSKSASARPTPAPTPALAPAPAPAPAPTLAPAQALGPAPAATATATRSLANGPATSRASSTSSVTPTLVAQQAGSQPIPPSPLAPEEQQPMGSNQLGGGVQFNATSGTGINLMDVSAFMTEQLRAQMTEQRAHDNAQQAKLEARLQQMEAKIERQRKETEVQRQEYEAKLEARRQEMEAKLEGQRQEMEAKKCVSDAQLEGLQERFDALHQAKLLTDDEIFVLEDILADFIECRSSVTVAPGEMNAAADTVRKLVGMCEGVSKDGMFARQLRRKFLQVQ